MKKLNLKENLPTLLFIVFFGVLLVLFILTPKKDFSQEEKRYLSELPALSADTLLDGSFTEGVEDYLGDHAPLRDFFVGVNSYFNYAVGNNGSNGVYLGRDGYLIEKPVSENNRFEQNVIRISDFSSKLDIPVYFALAPSKGALYSEKLPANHLPYLDAEYFSLAKSATDGKAEFIDLFSFLSSKKDEGGLYYKTDHHWTSLGAYLSYTEICRRMNITPQENDEYDFLTFENFFGTSYSKSGYRLHGGDSIEVWQPKSVNSVCVEISDGGDVKTYDTMFIAEEFDSSDKYNGFLGGNHSIVRIKNPNAEGRLIVIKDSFAHCLVPFLSAHYGEIVMLDLRYYKKPLSEFISSENPDAVLFMYSIDDLSVSTDIVLY